MPGPKTSTLAGITCPFIPTPTGEDGAYRVQQEHLEDARKVNTWLLDNGFVCVGAEQADLERPQVINSPRTFTFVYGGHGLTVTLHYTVNVASDWPQYQIYHIEPFQKYSDDVFPTLAAAKRLIVGQRGTGIYYAFKQPRLYQKAPAEPAT